MTNDLLDLVLAVRAASGRPLDDVGLQRVRNNISAMTPGEATEQRKTLKAMLDLFNRSSAPVNRNKP